MSRAGCWVFGLALAATGTACVTVGTDDPIEIRIEVHLQHDIRVRLDAEVEALVGTEQDRTQVSTRGIDDDFPLSPEDARAVEAAKADGTVGERYDGFLGVVEEGENVALRGLAERVNSGRRETYQALASEYATDAETVGLVAGAGRIELSSRGVPVLAPGAEWRQKP